MDITPADLNLPPTQPLDLTELNDWLVASQNERDRKPMTTISAERELPPFEL